MRQQTFVLVLQALQHRLRRIFFDKVVETSRDCTVRLGKGSICPQAQRWDDL